MRCKKFFLMPVAIVFAVIVICAADATPASAGPAERNRVWQLFNNSCHTPQGMSPAATVFETNVCLAVHRRSSRANRRRALTILRRIDAVRFYDYQMEMLLTALNRRRPDFFIGAVGLLAAPTPRGEFLRELTGNRERVALIMSGDRVPLE